jgi:hypothetical protein
MPKNPTYAEVRYEDYIEALSAVKSKTLSPDLQDMCRFRVALGLWALTDKSSSTNWMVFVRRPDFFVKNSPTLGAFADYLEGHNLDPLEHGIEVENEYSETSSLEYEFLTALWKEGVSYYGRRINWWVASLNYAKQRRTSG